MMKTVHEEKNISAQERFKYIESHINALEKSVPSSQELSALKEEITNFAALMCATHIKQADNQSEILAKLKAQENNDSLVARIFTFIKD